MSLLDSSKPYPVPSYNPQKEKWLDLDGTMSFYLKIIFGESQRPITEVNFFHISTSSNSKFVSIIKSYNIANTC